MKTMTWMTVAIAGLSLLPACGSEDLSAMDPQMAEPVAENLVQTSNALTVAGNTYHLSVRGGSTGDATSTKCPSGYVAVGIYGRSWLHIDRLGLVCRVLNVDGSLGITYNAGAQGGFGGASFKLLCPNEEAIVGFQSSSSDYVHQLGLRCAKPSTWGSPNMEPSYSPVTGSNIGVSNSDLCPKPYMVTSLNLRVGSFVDQMQTLCSELI